MPVIRTAALLVLVSGPETTKASLLHRLVVIAETTFVGTESAGVGAATASGVVGAVVFASLAAFIASKYLPVPMVNIFPLSRNLPKYFISPFTFPTKYSSLNDQSASGA